MKKIFFILGCFFLVAIIICSELRTGKIPQTEPTPETVLSLRDIAYSARYTVKKFLTSPSSAVFPPWPDESYRVIELGNNTYIVTGSVTAKNAFGIVVEDTWLVRLKFSGHNLEIINVSEVQIVGETVYNAP